MLFTANDAYMRDFNLVIPADCVASNDPEENRHSLEKMRTLLKADIRPSTEIDLEEVKHRSRQDPDGEPKPQPQARQFADRG